MSNRHLAPKLPGKGDQPSTDQYIGHAHMTAWEHKYNDFRPFGSYPIRPEWDELDRDFIAYWQLAMQKLIKEYGRHDIKPVLAIDRWLLPVMREGDDPKKAPDECWEEYDKATTGGGGARSTRNHADGRVLDEKGETVGRWDDNRDGIRQQATSRGEGPDEAEDAWRARQAGQTILDKVKRWAAETHHGKAHVRRWQEAANGIEPGTFPDAGTMTSAEASEYAVRFMASRWEPAARAIRDREIGFTGGGTVDAELEETLKVINARPDVEVRKYNPETNTLDLLSPAETSQIAPEHVDRFCEYLERERLLVAKECGSQHPAIKCKVYEGYIEDVRSGERVHSQIMFNYEQFLGWLRGEYGQRTAKETTLWADGTEDDHASSGAASAPEPDDAHKAGQDAYAEEVKRFQAARDAGEPDAQQGFDEWRLRDSPERIAAKEQLAQQKALREAIPGDNAALAARTQEILEEAAKDAPTPEDIAAAVAAGDWHAVAALAKAQAKAQVPPEGYVWFGWIRQGSIASGQYICIGDGEYEEAILYLASDFGGREPKPRLYQQNALNGPCRVKHSHDWNDCRREGPFLKTWEEIRAEYGNI